MSEADYICCMHISTVIFDMDGLLIDSEPFWQEAGKETLEYYGASLNEDQYKRTTGLRTEEWIDFWFHYFDLDKSKIPEAVDQIIHKAIEKISQKGEPFKGATNLIHTLQTEGFKTGLATSSPLALVNVVLEKLQLNQPMDALVSAEKLPYGKPHPQVYLNCANALNVRPVECVAFEDSFFGMIAAKAAHMKCIVIPNPADYHALKWHAADLILENLHSFSLEHLKHMN